jgi:aminoglycoside phosphotransferase (APT) family kinase protein
MLEVHRNELVVQEGLIFIEEGFDNIVYRNAEKTLVYRFPKKTDVVIMLKHEYAILPILARMGMGATIPVPILKEYKKEIYAIYPYVENIRYDALNASDKEQLIIKLSQYLSRQHKISDVSVDVPQIDYRKKCHTLLDTVYNTFTGVLNPKQLAYATKLCQMFLTFESGKRGVLHGDISFDHVFFSSGVMSIIDWSDVHMGDPAYEFYHLLRACNKSERILLKEHYTTTDINFWERAELFMYLDTLFVLDVAVQKNNTGLKTLFLERISTDMALFTPRI